MKTLYDIVTRSPEETVDFGRKLAAELQPPCVALLDGDLGSGKTTLAKGVVAGLGVAREEEVTSPSFTLVHEYGGGDGPSDGSEQPIRVYHVDLYRVDGAREAESLGLDDLYTPHSTVMIEWADKLAEAPPGPLLHIWMEVTGEDERRIVVKKEDATTQG